MRFRLAIRGACPWRDPTDAVPGRVRRRRDPGRGPASWGRARRGPRAGRRPGTDRLGARGRTRRPRAELPPRRPGLRLDVALRGARGLLRPRPRHGRADRRQASSRRASSTSRGRRSDTSARSVGTWPPCWPCSRSASASLWRCCAGIAAGSTTSWRGRASSGRCEGTRMSLDVLREAIRLAERGERVGLATIVATRGSTPQKVGARLLARDGQRLAGTLGGGAVEAESVREATLAATGGVPALREYAVDRRRRLGTVRRHDARAGGAARRPRPRVAPVPRSRPRRAVSRSRS